MRADSNQASSTVLGPLLLNQYNILIVLVSHDSGDVALCDPVIELLRLNEPVLVNVQLVKPFRGPLQNRPGDVPAEVVEGLIVADDQVAVEIDLRESSGSLIHFHLCHVSRGVVSKVSLYLLFVDVVVLAMPLAVAAEAVAAPVGFAGTAGPGGTN